MMHFDQQVWPTTPAQKGIWLGSKISEHPSSFNTAEYVCIKGLVDARLLSAAMLKVLESTQAFNVIFSDDGEYQWPVHNKHRVPIVDFSNDLNPGVAAHEWMNDQLLVPLDISSGDLASSAVIKIDEHERWLFLKAHHIVIDGYGFTLIFNKVWNILEAKKTVCSDSKDYQSVVMSQTQYRTSDHYRRSGEYWYKELDGLTFPASFSENNAPIAKNFIREEHLLKKATRMVLAEIAQTMSASWADVLLAMVAYALIQRTGKRQVSLGLPVIARESALEFKTPIMSMNIIPLVIDVGERDTVRDLISKVGECIKRSRPVSRFRYEELRAWARKLKHVQGDRLWGPVVNIMPFVRPQKILNCTLSYHNVSAGPVEDISFGFISKSNGQLLLSVDGNPSRYSKTELALISQQVAAYIEQCQGILDKTLVPETSDLSWLEGKHFRDGASSTQDVWRQIKRFEKEDPNAAALVEGNRVLTYQELIIAVEKLSSDLQALGLSKGNLCALALPRGTNAILALLSCIKLEVSYVFIDPTAPLKRNQQIISDSEPFLVLFEAESKLFENYQLNNSACITTDGRIENSGIIATSSPRTEYLNSAYLIYTSGSTGKPKGVVVSRVALNSFIASAVDCYGFKKNDKVLQFSPLHFDACVEEIFCTLCVGGTLYLRTEEMSKSLDEFQSQCQKWSITIVDIPTAFWHEMSFALHKGICELAPTIHTVIIGGEAVKKNRLDQWLKVVGRNVKLFNSYGPTEATVVVAVEPLHPYQLTKNVVALGRPLPSCAIAVVDEHLNIVTRGKVGELLIMGKSLANGYLNLPNHTEKAFINIAIPGFQNKVRAYRSGDLVELSRDGQLVFRGRIDDQLKISGHRVDPAEIEAALESLPHISEAQITVATVTGNKQLAAHIAGIELVSTYANVTELNKQLAHLLPTVMQPSWLFYYDTLPRSPNGKIDRKLLSQQANARVRELSNLSADRASTADKIKKVWREILGVTDISTEDDFFALGGQSLQVIQLANRLSELKGETISAAQLFANPKLSAMQNLLVDHADIKDFVSLKELVTSDCAEFQERLALVSSTDILNSSRPYVLVTGASGFVGAHIFASYLKNTSKTLVCLTRYSFSEFIRKIKTQCSDYGIQLPLEFNFRVVNLTVDFHESNLGLDDLAIEEYFAKADAVVHCAANTSVTRDYSSLRSVNALATGELLKLCKRWGLKFRHISTLALAPGQINGNELAEDFIEFHSGLSDGYQQSKWAAEKFVQLAAQQGIDVRVYRLGRVVGGFEKSYVNSKDLVWQIISQSMRLGALPNLDFEEPWTAASEVADFIVANQGYSTSNKIFNVLPNALFKWKQALVWLRELGFGLGICAVDEWSQKLKHSCDPEGLALYSFFEQKARAIQSGFETQLSKASNQKFIEQANKQQQELTAISKSQFSRYMEYLVRHAPERHDASMENLITLQNQLGRAEHVE